MASIGQCLLLLYHTTSLNVNALFSQYSSPDLQQSRPSGPLQGHSVLDLVNLAKVCSIVWERPPPLESAPLRLRDCKDKPSQGL
jgi:hypothetical protein